MNESDFSSPTRPRPKRRGRLKTLNRFLAHIGPLVGAIPGVFMLWVVIGPVLHSHKFSPAAVLGLAFIAAGILLIGAFLGAILGCLTFITQKLLANEAPPFSPSAPAPTTAPAKTRPYLLLSLIAALVFFFVGFSGGAIWTLHCVYMIKVQDAAMYYLGFHHGESSMPPAPEFPSH